MQRGTESSFLYKINQISLMCLLDFNARYCNVAFKIIYYVTIKKIAVKVAFWLKKRKYN